MPHQTAKIPDYVGWQFLTISHNGIYFQGRGFVARTATILVFLSSGKNKYHMEDPGIYIYIYTHGFCQFQNFASFQFLNSKQHISNCNKSNSFEPYLVPQCPRQKKTTGHCHSWAPNIRAPRAVNKPWTRLSIMVISINWVSQNGWFIKGTPLKWMIYGYPHFRKTPYLPDLNTCKVVPLFRKTSSRPHHLPDLINELAHGGYKQHLPLQNANSSKNKNPNQNASPSTHMSCARSLCQQTPKFSSIGLHCRERRPSNLKSAEIRVGSKTAPEDDKCRKLRVIPMLTRAEQKPHQERHNPHSKHVAPVYTCTTCSQTFESTKDVIGQTCSRGTQTDCVWFQASHCRVAKQRQSGFPGTRALRECASVSCSARCASHTAPDAQQGRRFHAILGLSARQATASTQFFQHGHVVLRQIDPFMNHSVSETSKWCKLEVKMRCFMISLRIQATACCLRLSLCRKPDCQIKRNEKKTHDYRWLKKGLCFERARLFHMVSCIGGAF